MEETTGGTPEGKTEEIAPSAASEAPAGEGTAAIEPAGQAQQKAAKKHDWKTIALVAVSSIAVLLLVATIVLAVTGDFGGHKGLRFKDRLQQHGQGLQRMPGRGPGSRKWQEGESQLPRFRRQLPDQSAPGPDTTTEPAPGVPTTPGQGSSI
ncbi:MAG: hypothetical protein KKF41_01420 [Actinobacteria bacterium]|nr:hypothetical protein [Actinomycetota bacterium]MBU1943217.1 hypothetical protein [Actinomycetota bacterium]MBU2686224.1 hypothetical protein [Actinomycetota bacterium]